MVDVSGNSSGLLNKISSLYNNPLFSDIEFVFISDAGKEYKIFCHKLILALRSKSFADKFFGEKESTSTIRLPVSEKASFELLFKFLYTDDVQFHSKKEALDLYSLADQYDIEELYEKCYNYVLKDKLCISNLFSNYDCALKKNINMLIKDCREFVCSNTQLVLKSQKFITAPPEIVEDIIKQDNLLVSSELDVITAVLNWGKEDLKNKNILYDEKSLRKHVNPFMKHLRFLTLSSSEFDSFVENYDILNAKESNVITKKIMQPECNVNFPEGICCISNKRRTTNIFPMVDLSGLDSKYRNANSTKSITSELYTSVNGTPHKSLLDDSKYTVPVSLTNVVSDSPKSMILDCRKSVVSNSKIRPFPPIVDSSVSPKSVILDSRKSVESNSEIQYFPPKFKPSDSLNSMTAYSSKHVVAVSKYTASDSPNTRIPFEPKKCRNLSLPSYSLGSGSIYPNEYSFPLKEIEPCIGLSFRKDITCSVTFKMKCGNISLRGFELKVKNNEKNLTEKIDVNVYVTGFSESFYETYKCELQNNSLRVSFKNPLILQEGNKGELQVSIENLVLNRCNVCDSVDGESYEINKGLHFVAMLYLKSNQKNDGFLFLFDKLLYTDIHC